MSEIIHLFDKIFGIMHFSIRIAISYSQARFPRLQWGSRMYLSMLCSNIKKIKKNKTSSFV